MYDTNEQPPPSSFEYVLAYDRESVIGMKTEAFTYADRVSGWYSHQKISVLVDILLAIKPKIIVQIGPWEGKSLISLAYFLAVLKKGKIYAIDSWEYPSLPKEVFYECSNDHSRLTDHAKIHESLSEAMSSYPFGNTLDLIRRKPEDPAFIKNIDILHIDGNHSDEASYLDVIKWVPCVRKGGWIVFDDLNWFKHGTTTPSQAIEYLNTHCHKLGEINELSIWGIWYKP